MTRPRASLAVPWPLVIGALLVVVGVLLGLQLMDADDPDPPAQPTAVSVASADPRDQGTDLQPAPARPDEPLTSEAPPEPTPAPPRYGSERLDLDAELERLGMTDFDPHARAVVEGRVVDGLDQPWPPTMVTLFDYRGVRASATVSDDEGRFRFESTRALPAGWSLSTGVEVTALMGGPDATAPARYVHPRDLRLGEPPVLVKLVIARAARVEGVVIDAATGAPAPFAMIEALSQSSAGQEASQMALTEPDGSFSMALTQIPADDVLIIASDPAGRQGLVGPLDLSPGEVRLIELTLQAPVSISGRIIDDLSGLPLAGASVTALPIRFQFAPQLKRTAADAEGHFTLDGLSPAPGWLRLHVAAGDHAPALVTVTEPGRPLTIRLGPTVVLHGTIHDGKSALPVRFASVSCELPFMQAAGPSWTDSTLCDEQGAFKLRLRVVPASAALLVVDSPGHLLSRRPLAELLPLQHDSSVYTLRIDLARTHTR